jgi:hypothetical protein
MLFVGCVDSYPGRASRGPGSPGLGYAGLLSVWFDMPNSILVDGIEVPDVMGGRKWEKNLLLLILLRGEDVVQYQWQTVGVSLYAFSHF